jgi:hypothetical protein
MRVVELSDHPGALLRGTRLRSEAVTQREQSRYQDALAQHRPASGRPRRHGIWPAFSTGGGRGCVASSRPGGNGVAPRRRPAPPGSRPIKRAS